MAALVKFRSLVDNLFRFNEMLICKNDMIVDGLRLPPVQGVLYLEMFRELPKVSNAK